MHRISRVDDDRTHTHAWLVSVQRGTRIQPAYPVTACMVTHAWPWPSRRRRGRPTDVAGPDASGVWPHQEEKQPNAYRASAGMRRQAARRQPTHSLLACAVAHRQRPIREAEIRREKVWRETMTEQGTHKVMLEVEAMQA